MHRLGADDPLLATEWEWDVVPEVSLVVVDDVTEAVQAFNRFSDGFPILITNTASLAELNDRLNAPLPMNRFRPNLVIDGLDAFDEDHIKVIPTKPGTQKAHQLQRALQGSKPPLICRHHRRRKSARLQD